MIRVIQRAVVVGDPQPCVGADQGVVQKLPLLMVHVGDQQGEKDVEPLDLRSQQRFLHTGAVQHFIHGAVHLADGHNIDTVPGSRGDLDELAADVGTGPVELMALQWSHNKDLDALAPHPGGHELHGKTFARAAGAQNRYVGVLIDPAVEDVYNDEGVVVLVDAQEDAVIIAHLITGEGVAAGRAQGQHIALGPFKEAALQADQGQGR